MIEQKFASNVIPNMTFKFEKSRRIRIIKNLIYLISLLDFLVHYALMVELNVYQTFGKVSKSYSTAIPLCELPIKKYLPFSLSQMSLYILYLSILTLLMSTEAIRKSSYQLYRCYIIIKFIFSMTLLFLCTMYVLVDRKTTFIQTSIVIPRHGVTSLSIDTCLIYAREKMAVYILSVVNVFIFFMSMEYSKVFSFLKPMVVNV